MGGSSSGKGGSSGGAGSVKMDKGGAPRFESFSKNMSENSYETAKALKKANTLNYDREKEELHFEVNEGAFHSVSTKGMGWTESNLTILPKHFPNIVKIVSSSSGYDTRVIYNKTKY